MFVYNHGLMTFTDSNRKLFEPNKAMTRGMTIISLYKMAGSPKVDNTENPFIDVKKDNELIDAVRWGISCGIIEGKKGERFGADITITREGFALSIYRYASYMGLSFTPIREYKDFTDSDSISDYAKYAVEVLTRAGIMDGKAEGIFDPKGTITRAEAADILRRFLQLIEKGEVTEDKSNPKRGLPSLGKGISFGYISLFVIGIIIICLVLIIFIKRRRVSVIE